MANQVKRLGLDGEKGIVERAIAAGLTAIRQPLSGQLRDFPADIQLSSKQLRVLVESKVRALTVTTKGEATWTLRFDWLRKVIREAKEHGFDHGALFVRPKGARADRFVLIEETTYLDLLKRAK